LLRSTHRRATFLRYFARDPAPSRPRNDCQ